MNMHMNINIAISYLKCIVDTCCDPYDDVAMERIIKDDWVGGYRVVLETPFSDPEYGNFRIRKRDSFIIYDEELDKWTIDQLKKCILYHIDKVHDERNCHGPINLAVKERKSDPYFNPEFFNFNAISSGLPEIKDVIYHDPATIVLWNNGTKTVVKAQDEAFDPEKGLAMAYIKKIHGNKGNYYNLFRKWLPDEEK